jgi:hypothetical protein
LASLDCIEHLAAMDRHFAWGFDAQANLVASDFNHNDRDVVVDDNAFVFLTG